MSKIVFATGNSRKIQEANDTLASYGITVESIKIDIDEIQHEDPAEITKAKARAAYAVTHQPVVVSDTSWSIPALGGFPAGYMKDIAAWWQQEDWQSVMARHEDKTIYCLEHVAYCDGDTVMHFEQRYTGHFIDTPRGKLEDYESFESLVILYGNKTMAEQLESGDIASAGEELGHWRQFAEWYSRQS